MTEKQHDRDDVYARDSFSMRGMSRGQVRAVTIFAVIVVAGLLAFALV